VAGALPVQKSGQGDENSLSASMPGLAQQLTGAEAIVAKVLGLVDLSTPKPLEVFDKFKSARFAHGRHLGFPSPAPALI
jgi:hypothetical protein